MNSVEVLVAVDDVTMVWLFQCNGMHPIDPDEDAVLSFSSVRATPMTSIFLVPLAVTSAMVFEKKLSSLMRSTMWVR